MAAEILGQHVLRHASPPRFNEAAANGRGNRSWPPGSRPRRGIASMRPRRMAAEIGCAAGRRPRNRCPRFNEAAANGRGNRWRKGRSPTLSPSFNEAAANGRGNRIPMTSSTVCCADASMRPRRMAAEIVHDLRRRLQGHHGFNEAAANGRGNRPWQPWQPSRGRRFNEAAANGRGNLEADRDAVGVDAGASMRPRRMAAEIYRARRSGCQGPRGFNEAAANGRGNRGNGAKGGSPRPVASMRPRRMAAEIGAVQQGDHAERNASMRPRRMAAEIVGGVLRAFQGLVASMRPRRMAAEIIPRASRTDRRGSCFNEAAANGRGNRTSIG